MEEPLLPLSLSWVSFFRSPYSVGKEIVSRHAHDITIAFTHEEIKFDTYGNFKHYIYEKYINYIYLKIPEI